MRTKESTVAAIARDRVQQVLNLKVEIEFTDAARVNRIAEIYGGTYTEAWSAVREEFRRQMMEMVDRIA